MQNVNNVPKKENIDLSNKEYYDGISPSLLDNSFRVLASLISQRTDNVLQVQKLRTKRLDINGKIIDQYGMPVSGALINAVITYYPHNPNHDLSRSSSNVYAESDINGYFIFPGIEGISFSIKKIFKNGYLFNDDGSMLFMLTNMNDEQLAELSNKKSPLIYKAWKSSDSISIEYKKMRFNVEPDGQIYTVDLKRKLIKKGGSSEGVHLSAFRESISGSDYTQTPWYIKLAIPNGGIIEVKDDFNYLAPVSGYQPEWSFTANRSDDDWKYDIKNKKLFFVGHDDVYGIIKLTARPFYGYKHDKFEVIIEYGFNEPGVRYLEPK